MTPEKIAAVAADLKAAGLPDACNRWIGLTPEALAANEARRARITRQTSRQEVRRVPKAQRSVSTLARDHAANLDDVGRALLKEITKTAEARKKERLAALKERTMKPGPRELELRAKRAMTSAQAAAGTTRAIVKAVDDSKRVEPKPATPAQPVPEGTKAQETTMTTKTTAKKAKAAKTPAKAKPKATARAAKPKASKQAAKENARTPAAGAQKGIRPGSKLEIIVGLLKRPEGCTSKQAMEACSWPSVSMPQQARAAGITLKTEKIDGVTVYRAD